METPSTNTISSIFTLLWSTTTASCLMSSSFGNNPALQIKWVNGQALQHNPASDPSAFSPSSSGDKFYLSNKHKSVKKKKKKSKHSKNRTLAWPQDSPDKVNDIHFIHKQGLLLNYNIKKKLTYENYQLHMSMFSDYLVKIFHAWEPCCWFTDEIIPA